MTLDKLMYNNLLFSSLVVIFGFVRDKMSFCPSKFEYVVVHEVVKGDLFEFLGLGCTNNWILLCELHQDWFYFIAIYKTCMSNENVMKKVRWNGIQLCAIFVGTGLFSWLSGNFKGGWEVHH